MVDISLCPGHQCPKKKDCLRYRAYPSHIQTYFSPPLSQGTGTTCEYFLPFKEKTDNVRPMYTIEEIP